RAAEVRSLLRQQSGGFRVLRKSASGPRAEGNRGDDNSSRLHQDAADRRTRGADAVSDGTRRRRKKDDAGNRETTQALLVSLATRNDRSRGYDYADLDV